MRTALGHVTIMPKGDWSSSKTYTFLDVVFYSDNSTSASYIAKKDVPAGIALSNNTYYDEVAKQIDIENICDFWIAETWTANNDIVNVRFFTNPEIDGGKWKFIFYDLDSAFYNVDRNYYQFSTSPSGMTSRGYSTFLLRNLMKSSKFKKTYLERLSYNLKNTWSTENVLKKNIILAI